MSNVKVYNVTRSLLYEHCQHCSTSRHLGELLPVGLGQEELLKALPSAQSTPEHLLGAVFFLFIFAFDLPKTLSPKL